MQPRPTFKVRQFDHLPIDARRLAAWDRACWTQPIVTTLNLTVTHRVCVSISAADSIFCTDEHCELDRDEFDMHRLARLCSQALEEPIDPKDLNVMPVDVYDSRFSDYDCAIAAYVTIGSRVVRIDYEC